MAMARDRKDKKTVDLVARMELGESLDPDWNIPSEYPDLRGYKSIAVDLETRDPNIQTLGPGWARNDGNIVGIAVAAGDYKGYFPIRHQNGHNLDPDMTMRWFKKQMATPDIQKVMHNATYDAGWLRAEGVEVQGKLIDTMIAAPLVNENRFSYSLNNLGRDYIDMRKDERMLRAAAKDWGIDPKADMWKLPPKFVGAYAEQDALMTLKLWEYLQIELSKDELGHIFELETSLIPMMLDMRAKGVRVDLDKAARVKKDLEGKAKQVHKNIKDKTGVDIQPWASASVQKMFEALNLQYPTTDAGAPSFTKQYLSSHPHEMCQQLVRLRELDKASSTFVESILRHEHKGRIHCEFHQLRSDDGGTVTGRFSSSNPNLQQIPARDPEIKAAIRGLFIPEEGEKWGSFDYASQEPRLLVHFAASMPDNLRHPMVDTIVEEYHKGDVDLHQMVADMAGISRKEAKTVNLGIMYGMGVGKLANQLSITDDEAKELLETHRQKVPFVKQLASIATQQGSTKGQIRTLLGRKCRFHLWEPRSFGYNKAYPHEQALEKYGIGIRRAFTYKALNKLIQGSAADQTKQAMADCYKEGLLPLLTVHDELCFSIESDEQAARIKDIMENGLNDVLLVPSRVDQELGDNWGEVG
jgi:DNA polymerase I-like protein with 3'-5' exonuclease and polymerase domains